MSSKITPALQVNQPISETPSSTERKSPNPESSYFSIRPRKKDQPSSPAGYSPGVPSTTLSPRGLLSTPPISEASSSKQETNYFNHRSLPKHSETTASDNLSTTSCVSGLVSSGGSFFHSSDTGRSPCSNSSSEYLEPPRFQPDNDNPPYKPRKQSTESLSMMKKTRRANTMPDGKKRKKRRHKKHHRNRPSMNEHQSRSCWWLPGCQIIPTAPAGQKELCRSRASPQIRQRSRREARTLSHRGSSSRGSFARPALTRRWSSVEVGAHQILLESTLPTREAVPKQSRTSQKEDLFVPMIQGQRYRSSSFTRGATDLDIIRTVREKLTHRKVPSVPLETPTSITLRRASQAISQPENAGFMQMVESKIFSDRFSPITCMFGDLHQRRQSAAYLITSKDIDTITELIEANLKHKYQDHYRETYTRSSTENSRRTSHSQSISGNCCCAKCDPQAGPNAKVEDVSIGSGLASNDYLQVNRASSKKKLSPRVNSSGSFHEVIWEGGKSPSIISGDEDTNTSPVSEASGQFFSAEDFPTAKSFPEEKGDAFDPNNARFSISEWSGRCPQNEISLVITSSHSEPNDSAHSNSGRYIDGMILPSRSTIVSSVSYPAGGVSTRSSGSNSKGMTSPKIKPFTRYSFKESSKETKVQDVVSFPPLAPRKTTNDWHSPLPEMEIAPPLSISRSLHDLGLDAYYGAISSNTVTPKASQAFQIEQSPPILHARSMDFNNFQQSAFPTLDTPANEVVRRKSIVKIHPNASPRIGEPSAIGSSIGSSTGERRSSAAPRIQRVRTIDNIHKGERDQPSSKWRKPSKCPLPVPLSPSEDLDTRGKWIPGPETSIRRLSKLRSGLLDRTSVLAMKCPPIPKVDCTGIYGSITGARRHGSTCEPCVEAEREGCEIRVCDDNKMDPRKPSVDWIG